MDEKEQAGNALPTTYGVRGSLQKGGGLQRASRKTCKFGHVTASLKGGLKLTYLRARMPPKKTLPDGASWERNAGALCLLQEENEMGTRQRDSIRGGPGRFPKRKASTPLPYQEPERGRKA